MNVHNSTNIPGEECGLDRFIDCSILMILVIILPVRPKCDDQIRSVFPKERI